MPRKDTASNLRFARGFGQNVVSDAVTGTSGGTVALSTDSYISVVTAAGAALNTLSLADGKEGQRKVVVLKTKGGAGNVAVTPTNVWGGTAVTLDTVGESCELLFAGGKWLMVGGTGALA
jgi:hypothetical protein